MYIVDTNYIVRSVVADNLTMTTEARNIFNKVANHEIQVKCNISVIFEVVYVLLKFYQYEKKIIYKEIMPILNLHNLIFNDKITVIQTLQLYVESNLDIVDCYLIIQAKNENLELLTFDKKCKNKLKELSD
jgi:predicted nucleic-acid-binding protein